MSYYEYIISSVKKNHQVITEVIRVLISTHCQQATCTLISLSITTLSFPEQFLPLRMFIKQFLNKYLFITAVITEALEAKIHGMYFFTQ